MRQSIEKSSKLNPSNANPSSQHSTPLRAVDRVESSSPSYRSYYQQVNKGCLLLLNKTSLKGNVY